MRRGDPLGKLTFGGRMPWSVGLVMTVTVVASAVVAFGSRHTGPLFELAALIPAEVWRGQLWRLVTWGFIQPSPIGLVFTCLFLYWFGRDLAGVWGSRRFLRVYGTVLLVAAAGTSLIAQIDRPLLEHPYLGAWALTAAMSVAWGLWFPDRVVRLYFVLPIRGLWLAWGTVAITVLFALYEGWDRHLPELLGEGSILAWVYGATLLAPLKRARRAAEERRRATSSRERAKKRAKSVAHLRLVESGDDDPRPLDPDLERRVDDLLGGRRKPKDDLN